ncbi:MAG: DUF1569 domain-containing protein, partial [Planctomyces sp.]
TAQALPTRHPTLTRKLPTMPVNPRHVQGRRELTFHSLQQVLDDVEQLAASPATRTLGNWSLAQLLNHLALTMNGSIDGFSVQAPWFIRLLAPLFKQSALKKSRPEFGSPNPPKPSPSRRPSHCRNRCRRFVRRSDAPRPSRCGHRTPASDA